MSSDPVQVVSLSFRTATIARSSKNLHFFGSEQITVGDREAIQFSSACLVYTKP